MDSASQKGNWLSDFVRVEAKPRPESAVQSFVDDFLLAKADKYAECPTINALHDLQRMTGVRQSQETPGRRRVGAHV